MRFCFKNREINFSDDPLIMGIVNVTPDSFSDGGNFLNPEKAVDHCLQLLEDGADIIDIGGESTRPGAPEVSIDEEIRRIVPVIEGLRKSSANAVISVDTRKAEVARAAIQAGADIINDVSGLEFSSAMADVAAEFDVGLILMHMRGTPEDMQHTGNLAYRDIIGEINAFLSTAIQKALDSGVKRENIVLDPGIGFAKTVEQNLTLIGQIERIRELGHPVLVGHSRKSFIGALLDIKSPKDRIFGTIGVSVFLAAKGVEIIRVHDVRETCDALKMFKLCTEAAKH
jgi:dihydropteroate synthase